MRPHDPAPRLHPGPDAPARALESLVRAIADRGELSARQLAVLQAFGRFCLEQLAEECVLFLSEAKTFSGSGVPLADDMVLFSHIVQQDSVAYRSRVSKCLIERDVDGIESLIGELNACSQTTPWSNGDGSHD